MQFYRSVCTSLKNVRNEKRKNWYRRTHKNVVIHFSECVCFHYTKHSSLFNIRFNHDFFGQAQFSKQPINPTVYAIVSLGMESCRCDPSIHAPTAKFCQDCGSKLPIKEATGAQCFLTNATLPKSSMASTNNVLHSSEYDSQIQKRQNFIKAVKKCTRNLTTLVRQLDSILKASSLLHKKTKHVLDSNCYMCQGSGVAYVSDGCYGHCIECCGSYYPERCDSNCAITIAAHESYEGSDHDQ